MSYNGGYGGYSGGYGGGGGGYGGGGYGGGYGGGGGGGGYGGGGYGGGGYGRGPRRNDRGRGPRGGGRTLPETTAVRMRKMIAKYAEDEDFDALEDPPRLAKVLRRSWAEGGPGALEGFRNAVTEQPYKHPHLVTLLLHLAYSIDEGAKPPADEPMEGEDNEPQTGDKRKAEDEECGREVIEDLGRAFRNAVEGRQWRDARLLLQFLSLLVPAGLVSSQSIIEVYKGLLTVINEVGGGGDRAERACRAVTEGLMRSAHGLVPTYSGEVEDLVGSIEMWVYGRKGSRELINPFAPILDAGEEPEPYKDSVSEFLAALHALRADGYAPPSVLPRPSENVTLPEGAILPDAYNLSPVNMPPDLYEASDDLDNGQVGEGQAGCLRLFAEDVVPPADTVMGWTLRSLFLDMINIYEVNRKECARLLLALPHHLAPGTFKAEGNESTVSLESLIVNSMLAGLFSLNPLPFRPIYYGSVITELCKLSPTTVAPPVGRAVRKLFTMMGAEGLDLEIAHRAAEWFAIHLSNFGFQWMWKEWVPELELPTGHPKRAFMRRVVELEVRLAYHDRIHQTLPEPMLEKGAGVIADSPPEPVWEYESSENPLHAEATELLRLMRQKVPANEVKSYLDNLPGARDSGNDTLSAPVLKMAVETIQNLGARSFSHFLNATERYLDVLRHMTPDAASRRVLLDAVASFWAQSAQMRLITTDKYLQYGILEPMDVVSWVFAEDPSSGTDAADGWTDGDKWELLRMTLDKVQGRVKAVSRRLAAVEKADEVARARRAAERLESGEGVGDDEEDETLERSREARDVQASLDLQSDRADKVFVATTQAFISELLPWAFPAEGAEEGEDAGSGLKAVLALQDAGELGAWSTRAKWGWYREFARRYATGIRDLNDRVQADILAKIPERADSEGPEARAENMVRRVWKDAVQLE